MCMCLVLFVVSKILDSSELLSCLLERGVACYLVCIREGLLCGKGVEPPRGRGRLRGARESQLFFGVYYNKNVFKGIGSEYLLSICRAYIYIIVCSAGYAELPVVLLYLLQWLVYHMLSKTRRSSGSLHRVIDEALVLGLLVVVYKIPYSSCMFNTWYSS